MQPLKKKNKKKGDDRKNDEKPTDAGFIWFLRMGRNFV